MVHKFVPPPGGDRARTWDADTASWVLRCQQCGKNKGAPEHEMPPARPRPKSKALPPGPWEELEMFA